MIFIKNSLNIRQATLLDLNVLLKNEMACYDYPWTKAMLLQSLENQLKIDESLYEDGANIVFVMLEDSKIVGHMIVQKIINELHLHNLCVLPEFQNRQLGKRWMNFLMSLASQLKSSKVFLEVRESNVKAIKLYERYQFRFSGSRKSYYKTKPGEKKEDAFTFVWDKG